MARSLSKPCPPSRLRRFGGLLGAAGGRSGSALIITLGVLALVSLLAFTFVSLARSERHISQNYVDQVRASILARSGIEQAVARLRATTLVKAWDDPRDPWVFHTNNNTGVGAGQSIATAVHPSFESGTSFGRPFSAVLPGTHAPNGDTVVLKVVDAAGQINLNSPQANFGQILNTLGQAILQEMTLRGLPNPMNPINGKGPQIVIAREAAPGGRFVTEEELRPSVGADAFEVLRDYVTVWGWEDPTTTVATALPTPEGIPNLELQTRAPVNINTAPRAVLQTVLTGLKAQSTSPISLTLAGKVADRIMARRWSTAPGEGPFKTWKEVYSFFDDLVKAPTLLLTPAEAAVCKANFNPNSTLHAFNPERVINLPIDKADLTFSTTEFTFRSMGVYEIYSLGRVFQASGEIVAESVISSTVQVYDVFYATTQDDFEDGRTSDAADNTASFPGSFPDTGTSDSAWFSGYIHLLTHQYLSLPTTAQRQFEAPWRDMFTAAASAGNPTPGGSKDENLSILDGSDLFPDGSYANSLRREPLTYAATQNLPPDEGTIEFWVKFDRNPSTLLEPIFTVTHPFTTQTGIQHVLKGGISGGSLRIESTRLFYVAADYVPLAAREGYPVPYANEKTVITATLPGRGQSNEWHHLVLSWFDGTDQRLYVDGQLLWVTTIAPTSNTWVTPGTLPYDPVCQFGGEYAQDGSAHFPNLTMDDVVVFNASLAYPAMGFFPRDRFEGLDPVYNGEWRGAFPPLPYPVTVGPIAWTEWIPDSYNGQSLISMPVGLALGLLPGGGNPGKGNGTVNKGGGNGKPKKPKKDKDDDDDNGGGGFGPLTEDEALCLYAPAPPPPPPGGGGNGGGNNNGGIPPPPPLPGNGNGGNAPQNFGVPQVLVANQSLNYSFKFVNPAGLTPLNVTPVIDDVTILYQGPVRFLAYRIEIAP
ncbi:MAG: hypothetical protein HYY93_05250 [Planctomycetes bacterium]|nr:hypothetical protein [Planctomycetota bacterium]